MPLEKRNRQDTRRPERTYCNLSPAGLFARRPRFISMTRDTYLHDERLNWNKQVKSHLHVEQSNVPGLK